MKKKTPKTLEEMKQEIPKTLEEATALMLGLLDHDEPIQNGWDIWKSAFRSKGKELDFRMAFFLGAKHAFTLVDVALSETEDPELYVETMREELGKFTRSLAQEIRKQYPGQD